MLFVVISNGPMGSDAFGAPQKTICNPEPDGPSGPGTTKLVQRSAEAPKHVQGQPHVHPRRGRGSALPLDCLGCSRTPPSVKTVGSGLEQTCQKRILDAIPAARRTHTSIAGHHGTHRTHGVSYDAT